jgi:Helix-turn-helix domain
VRSGHVLSELDGVSELVADWLGRWGCLEQQWRQSAAYPERSPEASSATSTGGMEAELNLLGWIGQMSDATEERRRGDVSCPGFHAPAVTAAGVTRHLGQARSFRIMAGEFSTGGAGEKSGSEMAALMRSGESREKSVIKVTQNSKPQAVMADRLWTVHDVSAFLGVPVGTLYQRRYMRVGPPAYRVGRHIRYDPAAVRTWLNAQDAYGR